jgi:hypothetical protein
MTAISWSRKLPTSSISRTSRPLAEIVGDLRDRLAELGAAGQLARRHGAAGVLAVFGVPDLGQARSAAEGRIRLWPTAHRAGSRVLPVAHLHTVGAAPTQR